jgi:hypothetical protein
MDTAGDMVINPDPCIGVATRDQFESSESLVDRAQLAIEKATALQEAGVVFLSKPFLFDGESQAGAAES